ncbi:MAG TPA: CPBP family intramembrane glutamic endopeptidase [Burkholderiales bacterium]
MTFVRTNRVLLATFPPVAVLLLNAYWKEPLYNLSVSAFWLTDFAQSILLPAICAIALGLSVRIWPRDYGFAAFPAGWSTPKKLLAFFITALMLLITYRMALNISWRHLWQYASSFNIGIPSQNLARGSVILYFALTAAVVEEAVFRALPWLYISTRFPGPRGTIAYILVTSILFAAAHSEQGPHGIASAFAFGLVAACAYSKLRNVWPLVLGHAITVIWAYV